GSLWCSPDADTSGDARPRARAAQPGGPRARGRRHPRQPERRAGDGEHGHRQRQGVVRCRLQRFTAARPGDLRGAARVASACRARGRPDPAAGLAMTPSGVRMLLTRSEMFHAVLVGSERQLDNIFAGRQDAYGQTAEDGWRSHNEGAAGEAATAKYFGVYWNGALGNLRAPAVGGAPVRTRSRHSYQLIVHPPQPKGRDRPNE